MKSPVFDFVSIKRKVDRQEQKAEFDAKNPAPEAPSEYAKACGAAVPFVAPVSDPA
jgi:hypothetical protein